MSTGFIKLHRKITEWEWYQDSNTFMLFIHLLFKANYKDTRYQGKPVKRGQMITGRIALSEETGISQQSIRTCLSRLEKSGEITIQSTNRFSLVTIVNYNNYQDDDRQSTSQLTNNQPTINQQSTTSKEVKNSKKVKKGNNKEHVFNFKAAVLSLDVDLNTLNDWLTVRKKKRASDTKTAFNTLLKEINKSGLHPQQAIEMAAANSWSGFKSEWVKKKTNQYSAVTASNINTLGEWIHE